MEESLKSESESEEDEGAKIQLQEVEGAEPDKGKAVDIPWWQTQAETGPICT